MEPDGPREELLHVDFWDTVDWKEFLVPANTIAEPPAAINAHEAGQGQAHGGLGNQWIQPNLVSFHHERHSDQSLIWMK